MCRAIHKQVRAMQKGCPRLTTLKLPDQPLSSGPSGRSTTPFRPSEAYKMSLHVGLSGVPFFFFGGGGVQKGLYYFKGLRPWAGSARRSPGRAVSKHVEAPKLP